MLRISTQFLGALCVFGCSGAFASPGQRGLWLDDQTRTSAPPIYDQNQGPPGQTQPLFACDPGQDQPGCPPAQRPSSGDDEDADDEDADDRSTAQAEKPDPWDHDPPARQPLNRDDDDAADDQDDEQAAVDRDDDLDTDQEVDDGDDQDVDDRAAPRQGRQDENTAPRAFSSPTGRARLGVMVMAMTPELRQSMGAPADRGVLVAKIEPGSIAARAGILVGDVVVRVGPRPVRSGSDIVQALADHQGDRIQITVIRDDRRMRLEARLSSPRPATPDEEPV
jgi:hypothetical protein